MVQVHSCPICKRKDNDLMVQCEKCLVWFHFGCCGFVPSASNNDTSWYCQTCTQVTQSFTMSTSAALAYSNISVENGSKRGEIENELVTTNSTLRNVIDDSSLGTCLLDGGTGASANNTDSSTIVTHKSLSKDENTAEREMYVSKKLGKPAITDETTPTSKTWDITTGKKWFRYVSAAHSRNQALSRLALMIERFPAYRDYAEGNLFRTMEWWAEYNHTWKLHYGLRYSNVTELWFLSTKIYLKK